MHAAWIPSKKRLRCRHQVLASCVFSCSFHARLEVETIGDGKLTTVDRKLNKNRKEEWKRDFFSLATFLWF
jgi:hypothetical protein